MIDSLLISPPPDFDSEFQRSLNNTVIAPIAFLVANQDIPDNRVLDYDLEPRNKAVEEKQNTVLFPNQNLLARPYEGETSTFPCKVLLTKQEMYTKPNGNPAFKSYEKLVIGKCTTVTTYDPLNRQYNKRYGISSYQKLKGYKPSLMILNNGKRFFDGETVPSIPPSTGV
ncbi:MAG: hypothetical protein WCK98_02895 [bacterium]